MNKMVNPYINYLLDNEPSPFCEYIIEKELLQSDAQTIYDAYEWTKRFTLYTEMAEEQFPDGSWGDFYPMDTSPSARKKHKITDRSTIRRLHDLSLPVDDEMVAKTLKLCREIITGEFTCDNRRGDRATHISPACNVLYSFCPNDPLVAKIQAERTLNDEKERAYMIYWWDHGPFDAVKLSDLVMPDDKSFVFWMAGLEDAAHNRYFGEFMAQSTVPFLHSLCDRLVNLDDSISILTNRYYSKVGQYSETWNNHAIKKKDLLLRIVRLLDKCG
ncbi:MAG: hypothetical protein FWE06_06060 [Oscillospiraceae bacterium]|nr:hypothetical protein [Oscillospiraceae bacterium]